MWPSLNPDYGRYVYTWKIIVGPSCKQIDRWRRTQSRGRIVLKTRTVRELKFQSLNVSTGRKCVQLFVIREDIGYRLSVGFFHLNKSSRNPGSSDQVFVCPVFSYWNRRLLDWRGAGERARLRFFLCVRVDGRESWTGCYCFFCE